VATVSPQSASKLLDPSKASFMTLFVFKLEKIDGDAWEAWNGSAKNDLQRQLCTWHQTFEGCRQRETIYCETAGIQEESEFHFFFFFFFVRASTSILYTCLYIYTKMFVLNYIVMDSIGQTLQWLLPFWRSKKIQKAKKLKKKITITITIQ